MSWERGKEQRIGGEVCGKKGPGKERAQAGGRGRGFEMLRWAVGSVWPSSNFCLLAT